MTFVNVIWGAQCGKSARWVLLGETSSRSHARSVRALARKRQNNGEAPQRANASRLVSTILFDLWAERWRRREATSDMILVRYADDILVGFENETDARRFWDDMRKRFDEFSPSLHPEKTRLIEFGRHAADRRQKSGLGKPETFNFLAFTHIC